MEKCKIDSQCNPDFSAGCDSKTGTCSPGKSYPNCTYDYECKNGEWCQGGEESGKCVSLLPIGQFGCEYDTSCVYNAGCHVANPENSYLNLCVEYGSIQPGETIKAESCIDNKSRLCSSGYCSIAEDGNYYCLNELKSLTFTPMRCYNSEAFDFCPSQIDKVTGYYQNGTCLCGLNEEGYGYCSLHHGDPPFIRYRKQLQKWLNSNEVKNCNTGRRFALSCAENYWNKDDYAILSYYALYVDYYSDLQGSDKCIWATVYPDYAAAKKEYEKVNAAGFLALSSLLLFS
ncbi:unnamed protein product [Blepharisma stoltei]|uniref:Dickkopf N-terminal cysteine-rich domain-containing protein n=1 Tax=Blepharisma stoltei TaxID=1481888 RepID=A0AAU9JHC5_9CILI|nr:unnamed protein product [Blepharisma stoltei]